LQRLLEIRSIDTQLPLSYLNLARSRYASFAIVCAGCALSHSKWNRLCTFLTVSLMSKRSMTATDAGIEAFAPQSKRPYTGYYYPAQSDHPALPDSLDLFDGPDFSSDLPDSLQLDLSGGQSLPLDTPSFSPPVALPADSPSDAPTSALLDDIKQRVADNLTKLILQHYSSDLGRLLPSLPLGQSLDLFDDPLKTQPCLAPDSTSTLSTDASRGLHVHDEKHLPTTQSLAKPHEWLPPPTFPFVTRPSALHDRLATSTASAGHVEARSASNTPIPLQSFQGPVSDAGPRTHGKSTSICWWDRFRHVPLHRLHDNTAQLDELRHTTLSALDTLRNQPAIFGTTANQNSFGQLIRAVWTPSTTISVVQIAICIILYIALPPEQTAPTDLPKHALHRDERPATWASQSRKLHSLWRGGSASKMRSVDYDFLYAKYATYVPEVQEKDFNKRMRDLVKYGGCYVFIAWQLGLGSLIALRVSRVLYPLLCSFY
jgi:hypothetical protein